jgi:hypothetical protein
MENLALHLQFGSFEVIWIFPQHAIYDITENNATSFFLNDTPGCVS